MKRSVFIFFLFIAVTLYAQQPDSSKMSKLGQKLSEYYDVLAHETLDVQKRECDFLIESTSDSLLRQFVALDIYGHYRDSKIMGATNVAVHIYDRWFADGKIKMKNEADSFAAQMYADFNRQSLLGEVAPAALMETIDGKPYDLFGPGHVRERFAVLYFYDTDCANCIFQSLLLEDLLSQHDYPVDLYAVYVGDDMTAWRKYVESHPVLAGAVNLWDPSMESDFQMKYGLVKTPRIFLVAPDGVILGRGLDVPALETLLEGVFSVKGLTYGGPDSEALYDGIFSVSGGHPSVGEVKGIADYIAEKTLGQGDTLMFRQMAGDYLYYLASRSGEGFKEGLKYHIDANVLSRDVWKSSDDSLKVIGFARIMSDLLSKAVPGSAVPAIKVPGELYTWRGMRHVTRRLDRLRGCFNVIFFYTEGCEVCAAEKKSALALLDGKASLSVLMPEDGKKKVPSCASRDVNVFMVNIDRLMTADPALATGLMDAFDLSSLPFIIITDCRGTLLRRYVTLQP